jgi:hypothetical protein
MEIITVYWVDVVQNCKNLAKGNVVPPGYCKITYMRKQYFSLIFFIFLLDVVSVG